MGYDSRYHTFQNLRDANAYAASLAGWPKSRCVQLHLPDDCNAAQRGPRRGYAWAIEAAPGKYLRCDGYVR
jgi:hypothetical protein